MFFTDIAFFIFLPSVILIYWGLSFLKSKETALKFQNIFLFIASYIFYGWVLPWTVLLMLAMTILHFFSAIWIDSLRTKNHSQNAKSVIILCTIISLTILSWYKYTNFVLSNLSLLFPSIPTHLAIILPAGVSFFTFHALAYTIDVYRGDFKANKNFVDFGLFMAFFPQLVAGPISRASNLLTQVTEKRFFSKKQFIEGIDLLFIGYVKKIVVADNIATYVNMIFDLKEPTLSMIILGGIGFSIQILADFSSYTDIARGCAKFLGFELIENFDSPYIAQSPSDFWRRWHMSLSNCIKDYIYIPLGGSKVSTTRWIFNIMFTWFLCGLWHGAGWNFIAWGLYWGIMLILYKYITVVPNFRFAWIIRLPVMYFWIVIGWILFRTNDLSLLSSYTSAGYFSTNSIYTLVLASTLAVFIVFSVPLLIMHLFKRYYKYLTKDFISIINLRLIGYSTAIVLLILFAAEKTEDFYYFQF